MQTHFMFADNVAVKQVDLVSHCCAAAAFMHLTAALRVKPTNKFICLVLEKESDAVSQTNTICAV